MIKNRIIIYRGDAAQKGIQILDHQPEGVFIYYPSVNDKIKLILHKDEFRREYIADISNPEYVFVNIDSDVPSGMYLYDVTLTLATGETYHVVVNQEIRVIGGN